MHSSLHLRSENLLFHICKKKHQWWFEWTKLMHILLHLDQPIRKAFHPCRQNFTIPHQPHILHVKHILIEHCTDARTTENWREKTYICVFAFIYRWNGSFGGKAKQVEIQTESIELPRLSKCWSWLITMALYFAVHQNILHCCPFVPVCTSVVLDGLPKYSPTNKHPCSLQCTVKCAAAVYYLSVSTASTWSSSRSD